MPVTVDHMWPVTSVSSELNLQGRLVDVGGRRAGAGGEAPVALFDMLHAIAAHCNTGARLYHVQRGSK